MAKDIAPELIETIKAEFQRKIAGSSKIKALEMKIRNKTASYRDAQEYAVKVSELMSEVLLSNLSADMLPDGKMYYNIAQRVMQESLGQNGTYGEISRYCFDVQEILNQDAAIGIKAVTPELNQDRIDGIVDIVSGKDDFDKIKYMLKEPLVNFGQSIVDEAVRSNADFQFKAGLSPKIVRISTGHCCEWCDKLTGTYEYSNVRKTGSDIWKRHKNCKCLVEYHPGNGKKQNAHTKIWESETELEKQKLLGLGEPLKKNPRELIKNAERVEKSRENGILITDKQFGKKIGKHAQDFGLNPGKPEDRKRMEDFILDIVNNHDDVAQGFWRGQTGLVDFFIKGNDVVILNKQRFVTILENGVQNERVKIARKRKV